MTIPKHYEGDLAATEALLREIIEEVQIPSQRVRVSCQNAGTHILVDCETQAQANQWAAYLSALRGDHTGILTASKWRDGFTIHAVYGTRPQ